MAELGVGDPPVIDAGRTRQLALSKCGILPEFPKISHLRTPICKVLDHKSDGNYRAI